MPSFNLYYDTGSFWLNAHIGTSFVLKGKFDEHDGILKLYAEDGTYSYVFHQTDHGYVYSAADSKPFEQKGFDWQEDLEFVKVNM